MQIQRYILEKAGVSQEDIRSLERAWDTYQAVNSQPVRSVPHIVCTGIYNAGKSTLLNALAEKDIFPTGDIPTTKAVSQAEFGGAVYVDTPGLNAEEADDQTTRNAYEAADFILFVSNAQNGGISAAEAEWLNGLRQRYTGESLRQRLIYVLSHSVQVEPEELSGIREHVQNDLERAIEFAPEQIFCVDSILYQQGREQSEPLLVENSGIPALQGYLAEQIASAEDTLRQAHETELTQRQQELLRQIALCQEICEKACAQKEANITGKLAELDEIWKELEDSLPSCLSRVQNVRNVRYDCGVFLFLHSPYHSYGDDLKSEREAKRQLEDALRNPYDEREHAVDKEVDDMMKWFHPYCTNGMDNVYFSVCDSLNRAFERCTLALQKIGISIEQTDDISIQTNPPSTQEIKRDLKDGVVRTGGYYSLEKYCDMYANIGKWETTENGRFLKGLSRKVTYYRWDTGHAVSEMAEDLKKALESNLQRVNSRMVSICNDFCRKLEPEIAKRKAAIKEQMDKQRTALRQSAGKNTSKEARAYLDTLEKEVSA